MLRLALDWRFEGPAAPFLLALDRGYFLAEGLAVTIEPGAGSREPIARVAAGTHDIGFGDINTLVRFRDENPNQDIRAIMMLHDRPPFAIVARKSRGVTSELASLRGKHLGAPAGDGAFAQWPVFRAINRIDETEWNITIENVGFPVREGMLAQGEVDGVFGYAMTSSLNLAARGVPAEDILVLPMHAYGLELYGNALIASQRVLTDKPDAVRGFVRALLNGLRDCVADPAAAVNAVLKRNELARREIELERLRMVLGQYILTSWARENGVGGIDRLRFERALDQIGRGYSYRRRPMVDEIFTGAFLPPVHERKLD